MQSIIPLTVKLAAALAIFSNSSAFGGVPGESIGTLGWGISIADINESGEIVGISVPASGQGGRAVYWSRETDLVEIGLGGGVSSSADYITDDGVVVGTVANNNGSSFVWTAYYWTPGDGMVFLPTDFGNGHLITDVDRGSGAVVGAYCAYSNNTCSDDRGFYWTYQGGMQSLPSGCYPTDVNSVGQVTGYCGTESFIWDVTGGLTSIEPDIVSRTCYAEALNNLGQVVGNCAIQFTNDTEAFYWSDMEGMSRWAVQEPGVDNTGARDINNAGLVGGTSDAGAWVWTQGGGLVLLDAGAGFNETQFQGLSESGHAFGFVNISDNSVQYGFAWSAADGFEPIILEDGRTSGVRQWNDHGQAVGYSSNSQYAIVGIFWSPDNDVLTLDPIYFRSDAFAVNNKGEVAGYSYDDPGGYLYDQVGAYWSTQPAPFQRVLTVDNIGGSSASDISTVLSGSLNGYVRDASTDALLGSQTFNATRTPLDVGVVDINGSPAIASLGEASDGRAWVEVRDAVTGALVRDVWYTIGFTPIALAVLPDMNGNNTSEVAVLMTKPSDNNRTWVHIKDSQTLAYVNNVWFEGGYTPLDLEYVPNVDGNAGPELAVLMTRDSDGRTWVHVKDAMTGSYIRNNWFQAGYTPKDLAVINNLDGNPGAELAVLFQRDSDTRTWVHMKDTLTGAYVRNVWFDLGFTPMRLETIPDLDTNAGDELAVLTSKDSDGRAWVLVKDALSGAFIRNVWFQGDFTPKDFTIVPDMDANPGDEIAVLGERGSGQIQVEIKDAKTITWINLVNFP
ncbi:MAG: hypothetical protein ACR2Q3_14300 [Woeseiaceae bacterium]